MSGSRRAGRRRSAWSRLRRVFSHRRLVMGEALLLVGAAEVLAERQVMAAALPPWAKVAFAMALVAGLFGALLLILRWAAYGVDRTHGIVQALPLPTPMLLVHAAALGAIFLLYAWVHGIGLW